MSAGRILLWTFRSLLLVLLLLVLAVAGAWWWAGQEGSLAWTLERLASGRPLRTEGVRGSLRAGWRIDHITWEGADLRVEARNVRLDWEPIALISRTLQLEHVSAGEVRITDKRKPSEEPMRPPPSLKLPWRVTVDDFGVGLFDYQGRAQVSVSGVMGRYAFDGVHHQLQLDGLQVAGGSYSGRATLLGVAPLDLQVALGGRVLAPIPGGAPPLRLQFEAVAQGPLADLQARALLRAERGALRAAELPSARVTARVTPFEPMPLPEGHAEFRALDLAPFWQGAPRTLLSGELEVAPLERDAWRVLADVRNGLPGPWDSGRLPVASARGAGEWRAGTALVRSLRAELGGGQLEGEGAWEGRGWRFQGRVEGVDPAQLHGQLAALPLTGPVRLQGEQGAVDFDLALQAGAAAPRHASGMQAAVGALELRELAAKGRWQGSTIALAPLHLRTSDATLDGEIDLDWQAWAGQGKLQLRAPALELQANGALAETRGKGTLDLAAGDLARLQQWLQRWPGMDKMLAGLHLQGSAQGNVAWQGGWRDPAVQGHAQVARLQWQPDPPARAETPLPWVLTQGDLRLDGRLRDAALVLDLQAASGQREVKLAAAGRLGGTLGAVPAWHGQLARLALQLQDPALAPGPWRLQLRQPADWKYSGGDFELGAGEAVLLSPAPRSGATPSEALVTWSPLRRHGGQLTTAGRIKGLPLAWIELVGGPQLVSSVLAGDMVFDAQWNAQLGSNLRVEASLARVSGDITLLAETPEGGNTRVNAGVRDAHLSLSNQGEQVTLALRWDSERAGHAEGQLRTQLARTADGGWNWPENAPLTGRLQAQLPRIGVWSVLAPPGWRLRGSLAADIAVAGTRTQPRLSGPLTADQLALRSVVDGIELANGRLRSELAGDKLVVSEFLLHGAQDASGASGGTLQASGEGAWTPQGVQLRVNAQLAQLRASIRSDRQLTVSGPVAARVDREGVNVSGQLVVDRARIQIPDESPPRLGDDVVVRNAPGVAATEAERREQPAPTDAGRTLTLAISFDLGKDFHVKGRGIDTELAGQVQVTAQGASQPELHGAIRTVGGTFDAYGQHLRIDHGEIRFTGPVDNPALDVLALRPNLSGGQQAGVQVTGRAQSPRVQLYSNPQLTEAETLSWLVLGRSSAGGGAETALLQSAAAALLAGRTGNTRGLAGAFGLDEVSLRQDSGGSGGNIVAVGKRFADNFYASYERSLSSATGTLYLFYDVSRRLTVRAEAGERAGLDLIFTFYFDGGRKTR
ncbi:DUF490 domain-containing protein [Ramlibacter sp. G-1-2-2]|uniref:DUF490 domain-containing protein n=1 Tax=Ramlibacter agri TaxID=2728837 RepID=A0A848H2U5_9BURK|nr:translocation/assembly module TamB domain-containing protein [Ramlibacter agri]NML44894.1 DUF490 domain-containing protein [Ramlibacter agri]